jgi:hypothetical protein
MYRVLFRHRLEFKLFTQNDGALDKAQRGTFNPRVLPYFHTPFLTQVQCFHQVLGETSRLEPTLGVDIELLAQLSQTKAHHGNRHGIDRGLGFKRDQWTGFVGIG